MGSMARQAGVSLIEVLVTILVMSIGLLGLAGLQSKMQLSEMEAYQRSQALLLLQDISSRISANKTAADSYLSGGTPIGPDSDCEGMAASGVTHTRDLGEWCLAIRGAGEIGAGADGEIGTGDDVEQGAIIGARGCVEKAPSSTGLYMVTIAWQGLVPLNAPPASVACGQNLYNQATGVCTGDRCRRVVTTVVQVPSL